MARASPAPGPIRLNIKVVPGARSDQIAGMLGERLKVRVAAPPEDGRANASVCRVIAEALGLKAGAVSVVAGHSSPEKTIEISGATADQVRALLA